MPKRKTGARKKKEKQAALQSKIRSKEWVLDLSKVACNQEMVCDHCQRRQKTRAFCYFCNRLQKLPACAECGRTKCMQGDCLVKHKGSFATGMNLVGATCDWCEAWVCHSRKCISQHGCPECPLDGAECVECTRTPNDSGGRFFKCPTCEGWLCEDDQFEHQASCTYLDTDNFTCVSCNKFGQYSCLKCKTCWCDLHVKGSFQTETSEEVCKKCRTPLKYTKDLSISSKSHKYGRQHNIVEEKADEDEIMPYQDYDGFNREKFSFAGVKVDDGTGEDDGTIAEELEEAKIS